MTIDYAHNVRMDTNIAEIHETSVIFFSAIVRSPTGDMLGCKKPYHKDEIKRRLINDIDDQILLAAQEIAAKRSADLEGFC